MGRTILTPTKAVEPRPSTTRAPPRPATRERAYPAPPAPSDVRVPAYDLRTRVPRAIVALLDRYGELDFRRLCARVPAPEGLVSLHVERLTESGIVVAAGRQGAAYFRLRDAPQTMVLLAGCRDSWLDRLVHGFADAWFDLGA